MRFEIRLIAAILLIGSGAGVAATAADLDDAKAAMIAAVDSRQETYWSAAMDLWQWSEPGYQETRSAPRLADLLRDGGFDVVTGVAGIPTAFVASYGSGSPVIGILAEYDALPGLGQEAVPERQPRQDTSWGQGCGHHLFGVASTAAALAVADAIRDGRLEGTVRLYGTPAEEGGGAKVFMARAGLFADADAVLHWHPGSSNSGRDVPNLARVAAKFRFRGRAAHAASAPHQGRSAADAVILLSHCAELLREHTPDFTRLHHVITSAGEAPNVVPETAESYHYVRHPDAAVAQSIFERLRLCAEGAAIGTETELEEVYLGGVYNVLPSSTLSDVVERNLEAQLDISYDATERRFAESLQQTLAEPQPLETASRVVVATENGLSKGSTDVGDVSWVVPTAGFRVATWVPGTPAHSWQATAAGGTSIGRQGMMVAARTLAATAWDLMRDPETLARARRELDEKLAVHPYRPMLEPGQQPSLDYRDTSPYP